MMPALRRSSRQVRVGVVAVGGGAPVSVQSMTCVDTRDAAATVAQIRALAAAGADIVRVAVPDRRAAEALPEIVADVSVPVVADIHFDHRLALTAVSAGVAGLRLNPGNIGSEGGVRAVAEAAGAAGIPIRVGANAGSVDPDLLAARRAAGQSREEALAEVLVESALGQCRQLEGCGFRDIKVSLKASDVPLCVRAYRRFATVTDYPLHLGITEAGTWRRGTVKSAAGLGILLAEGIGDTLRVSLTADPVEEVRVGILLLESLGLREADPELVSCPTCGRTEIDLIALAETVECEVEALKEEGKSLRGKRIAVMGCVVNGPGEARDADLGLAGGKGRATVFMHGEPLGTWPEAEAIAVFRRELRALAR